MKRVWGAMLVGIALAVAAWFIVNSFFGSDIVGRVWTSLDILQCAGLLAALGFNFQWKVRVGRLEAGDGISRRYLEANAVFYATCALAMMFLHNWFALLATGRLETDDHQAWIVWDAINTLLPIVLGVTGCRLWREGKEIS